MRNMITYAEETLACFDRLPFNRVDSLILSWAAYLRLPEEHLEAHDWRGVRLGELLRAEDFGCLFQRHWDVGSSRRLFTALAASPRFRDIRVMGYTQQTDPEQEKQFSAMTFQLNGDMGYVAFRGTDSTLVGWKEDFNMAFQYPVPSQEEAERYLAQAAKHCKGELQVGGHSKGGNLAVYAAAHSAGEVQERIARVYSHDGPGFLGAVLRSGEFQAVTAKIDKTLPQSSLVGMLLEQQEKFRIRGERERETLQGCGHVTGRTGFDRRGSLACNPGLVYHKMNETMRPCFYEGKWDRGACVGHEIFISQGDYPLKGLHYLLQAMGEIRREFPDAHIRVAGISVTAYGTLKEKLKISGYGKYLRECIAQYGLEDCVEILGKLEGEEMKAAYLRCHVFVCPSALENSPNALGEAMLLGVPCVASRVGGIPDMAEDGKSALLF